MGGGSWTADRWSTYSKSTIAGKSASAIYSGRDMKPEFDPKNVTRESCDSVEHPLSTPIIIGLDVTGSMGRILEVMAEKLGDLVGEIYKREPVTDPQIMFNAIGDAMCDSCPLQATQFESDIRIAEQLTQVYFERGGGGNGFESYPLAWYFAANHTKTDNFDKRNKKGFLFTFGDDGFPTKLTKNEIFEIFGDTLEKDISIEEVLAQVNRQYEVFHFCMTQGGSHRDADLNKWKDLLGERAIKVNDYTKIPEIIVSILETMSGKDAAEVIASWDGDTSIAVANAINGLTSINKESELVEF